MPNTLGQCVLDFFNAMVFDMFSLLPSGIFTVTMRPKGNSKSWHNFAVLFVSYDMTAILVCHPHYCDIPFLSITTFYCFFHDVLCCCIFSNISFCTVDLFLIVSSFVFGRFFAIIFFRTVDRFFIAYFFVYCCIFSNNSFFVPSIINFHYSFLCLLLYFLQYSFFLVWIIIFHYAFVTCLDVRTFPPFNTYVQYN